jgi:hypothetical protein
LANFKKDIIESTEAINFAIFVAQRAKLVNGKHFHLEFMNTKRNAVFVFYVADAFNCPERLTTAINLAQVITNNMKYSDYTNNIMNNINGLSEKINKLSEINNQLKKTIVVQSNVVEQNEEIIADIVGVIRDITKSSDSHDSQQKLCIEITKHFILSKKNFVIKDIVNKSAEFGLKPSSTQTLISRQLGGLKNLRKLAQDSIDAGEPCVMNSGSLAGTDDDDDDDA